MHAVKGLEFKTVIVTNLAEKRFPLDRTSKEPLIPKNLNPDTKRYLDSLGKLDEEEEEKAIKEYEKASLVYEERRLCYVAFTRAKENLIVTRAKSYNNETDSASESLFLREINYKDNKDITVSEDNEEKCTIFAPCSRFEQFKSILKKQLMDSLDSDEFNTILSRLVAYHAVREGKIPDYAKMVDWKKIVDKKELETHLMHKCKKSGMVFDKKNFTFSPTALLVYEACPKKYELSQIFKMPERGAFGWSAASTGSFVHELFETGVKAKFDSKKQFIDEAEKMSKIAKWHGVNLKEVAPIIEVFWARNNGKYSDKSLAEIWIDFEIEGFRFNGKIDRIDFLKDKDVEIIDYKSGKLPDPEEREWQLGFYAIGVKKKFGYNPVKLTLDMLKLEKPFEAVLETNGEYKAGGSRGFNVNDVEKKIVECAKKVVESYEGEFLPVKDDGPCKF
jgi:DNA helicase-2/ATP-dependent DNA helicase PcrA